MSESLRNKYQNYLNTLGKIYYDPNQIAWFDDIVKKIELVINSRFNPDGLIYEHRMKSKEKFIAKFNKSFLDNKTNPNIDIFGIRLTGNFQNTEIIANYLIEFLDKTFTPEDFEHATIKETELFKDDLLFGTFHSIQFRSLSLEIQIMTPEIREYVNQTHTEYDYQKYGIVPEENQPQIKL